MSVVAAIITIISATATVLVSSIVPKKPQLSKFELDRRRRQLVPGSDFDQQRSDMFRLVSRLQQVVIVLLFSLSSISATVWLGWLSALGLMFLLALAYGMIARLPQLKRPMQRRYELYEKQLLFSLKQYQSQLSWLFAPEPLHSVIKLHSKSELEHLIEASRGVLGDYDKALLRSGIFFADLKVSECMKPRDKIYSVKKSEVLGPLMLDELHKTGHNHFPVISENIDSVIGILQLRNILKVDTRNKHTLTAENAMDRQVYYLHEDQLLTDALASFVYNNHMLAIVINSNQETSGVIALSDVIARLTGSSKLDGSKLSAYDDRRSVATYRL